MLARVVMLGLVCGGVGVGTAWDGGGGSGGVRADEPTAVVEAAAEVRANGPRDVSDLLRPIIEKHEIPGMAVAIVERGRVVMLGAAGVRRRGSPEEAMVEDKWHLGSCTKAMTATLCAVLVNEGSLRWESTVAEVFPDWAETMDRRYRGVTLEQLLQHRGGVPANVDKEAMLKAWTSRGKIGEGGEHGDARVLTIRSVAEYVLGRPPAAEPGTKMIYSNAGYVIAGAMAERVTGKGYEELMHERVFAPLGLDSAGWGAPGTAWENTQPRGHTPIGFAIEPGVVGSDNMPAYSPAGRAHMTITDWAKFAAAHAKRAGGGEDALGLESETYARMHAPAAPGEEGGNYAMGWGVARRGWAGVKGRPGTVLTHSGSNTLWYCVAWVAPEREFAVLVACNQAKNGGEACDEAAGALIRAWTEMK